MDENKEILLAIRDAVQTMSARLENIEMKVAKLEGIEKKIDETKVKVMDIQIYMRGFSGELADTIERVERIEGRTI